MNCLCVGVGIWLLSIFGMYKLGYALGYSKGEIDAMENEIERRK